jgi:hypothetical protein
MKQNCSLCGDCACHEEAVALDLEYRILKKNYQAIERGAMLLRDDIFELKRQISILKGRQMSEIKWTEIKGEKSRSYKFPSGDVLRFDNVVRIEVRESGKHRIETADGEKAFVNTGWIWLKIEADEWTF